MHKRAVLLFLVAPLFHSLCSAQQCYLVDSIRSIPAKPTTEDAISLTLYGDFIGARTKVTAASVTQEDQQVIIHLEVSCDSNTALVLTHREQLPLNALPVGRYAVRLVGSGAALMDTATTLLVAPYAGRYQSCETPPEMFRFDPRTEEFIVDLDPSLYVVRVRIYDADAKVQRETFIDGFGPSRISAKDLPDGNYLIRVDCDTDGITGWVSTSRRH